MPKRPAAKLTAKERERFFVNLYVEKGAVETKISYCEKRARLKPGEGKKILARAPVKKEVWSRTEPIREQKLRQSILGDATAAAKLAMQEELKNKVDTVQRTRISLDVLEHELMSGVIGLDVQKFPDAKLSYIKTAYIVHGTLEATGTRRVIPPDDPKGEHRPPGIYTSVFNRMALPAKGDTAPVEDGVRDLFPSASPPPPPPNAPMPAQGEAIDESAPEAKTSSRVITVEVG